eukprot:TRINITY_DN7742_c0_g1_i3.p1 TRINITY_DN7742_c0_g1~~TRINITY_DN7742_c0_g1_i3.p1  ORF type:complete len:303 (-),score=41.80 TRINITY_DN7742_c0_g1_i3:57-896(-)
MESFFGFCCAHDVEEGSVKVVEASAQQNTRTASLESTRPEKNSPRQIQSDIIKDRQDSQETPHRKSSRESTARTKMFIEMSKTRKLAGALATPEGQTQFKELFDSLDQDHSGRVEVSEWIKLLHADEKAQKFFGSASVKELKKSFKRIDKDHNNALSFAELVHAAEVFHMAAQTGNALQTEEGRAYIRNMFDQFDKDKNGQITYQEFVRAMCGNSLAMTKLLGVQHVNQETLREAFARIDKGHSHYITVDEFVNHAAGFLDDQNSDAGSDAGSDLGTDA